MAFAECAVRRGSPSRCDGSQDLGRGADVDRLWGRCVRWAGVAGGRARTDVMSAKTSGVSAERGRRKKVHLANYVDAVAADYARLSLHALAEARRCSVRRGCGGRSHQQRASGGGTSWLAGCRPMTRSGLDDREDRDRTALTWSYMWPAFMLLVTRSITWRTFRRALEERPIAVSGRGGAYVVDEQKWKRIHGGAGV